MAQREVVTYTCDLHEGEVDGQTVQFGHDGASYEIELCDKHRKEMLDAFEPFLNAARKAGSSTRRSAPRKAQARTSGGPVTKQGKTMDEVRQWLRANDYDVAERGRLSKELKEKYEYGTKDTFL